MAIRRNSTGRREQIIEAALSLLADTPLEELRTRQIARAVGISQPALFRHFRSMHSLLLAVIGQVRSDLGAVAESVLSGANEPLEQLRRLARMLLAHAQEHPGIPRLLFSPPQDAALRRELGLMLSTQSALITELVRNAQGAGEIDSAADPQLAATLFIGMIQGAVLRAQLLTGNASLTDQADPMIEMWHHGLDPRSGTRSSRSDGSTATQTEQAATHPRRALALLDVRPILDGGTDPLEKILGELATVIRGGVLTVLAPFVPRPLIALLRGKGHTAIARPVGGGCIATDIVVGGSPEIVDLTDLEAPEPLERVLAALPSLTDDSCALFRLPRVPRMLFPHLDRHKLSYLVQEYPDGTALVRLEHDR